MAAWVLLFLAKKHPSRRMFFRLSALSFAVVASSRVALSGGIQIGDTDGFAGFLRLVGVAAVAIVGIYILAKNLWLYYKDKGNRSKKSSRVPGP